MSWTSNDMRIEMNNTAAANIAIDTIKQYVADHGMKYQSLNYTNLNEDLHIENSVVVLENSSSMDGIDYMTFIQDISKLIAEVAFVESFNGNVFYASGYGDEGSIEISYENSILRMRSIDYPNGRCEYLCCEECGENIIPFDEYEENKIYICPECGEEIDLFEIYEEDKPVIEEIIINIAQPVPLKRLMRMLKKL